MHWLHWDQLKIQHSVLFLLIINFKCHMHLICAIISICIYVYVCMLWLFFFLAFLYEWKNVGDMYFKNAWLLHTHREKEQALINSVFFAFYYSIWFTFKYWPSSTTNSPDRTESKHIQRQCYKFTLLLKLQY